jgi:hypothetical protein
MRLQLFQSVSIRAVAVPNISGTATFSKVNGEALSIVKLNSLRLRGMHPGHIHANTAAQGGGIVF